MFENLLRVVLSEEPGKPAQVYDGEALIGLFQNPDQAQVVTGLFNAAMQALQEGYVYFCPVQQKLLPVSDEVRRFYFEGRDGLAQSAKMWLVLQPAAQSGRVGEVAFLSALALRIRDAA